MSDFILSCCSAVDLTQEQMDNYGISYIPFHFELNGVQYTDDLGQSVPYPEFYRRMSEGEDTKTSQVNIDEFIQYFEGFLKEGKDILHLTLSSGISGTFNSARLAKDMLEEKYPGRKLYVVDSLAASGGYGLLMVKLAELKNAGKSVDEVYEFAETQKKKLNHWFFTSDLTFFIKGGRVSKTAGFVGQMLNICPLLNVDFMGRLIPREKIRTKKKVIARIVDVMEEKAEGGRDYNGKVFITQSYCEDDAKAVAALIEERFPKIDGKVEINYIGNLIGSHTGPGTVALFFWGEERTN
ncbi:MAG: DegV family protein [Lachnospiraceae bacterium]|nr:DegV family protein [Lachnospiraceae bacterium]